MLIKHKDDCQEQIDYLSDLLERDFPEEKKSLIERELKNLYSGKKGEETSSYYLDFDFKKNKNWVLIHDLRIEHDGDVAQIDHLLIGKMLDIYVIESKNFNCGVSISEEGDFSYFYKNRPYAIPSPISQNARHIRLLDRYLTDNGLLPKRLGMTIKPNYRNIVLISPKSRLTKPKTGTYDCSCVMKADKFLERFKDDMNDDALGTMINITKVMSQQNLYMFAEKLVLAHKPIKVDYLAKFGLENDRDVEDKAGEYNNVSCPKCGKEMVKRVAKQGKKAGSEFFGCVDFPKCKGTVSISNETENEKNPPSCPKCDGEMIKRTSTKGENAGNEFWGCKKFPKCFGTLPLE